MRLLQGIIKLEVDREIVVQNVRGLHPDNQPFELHLLRFSTNREHHLHFSAQQQAGVFLFGDADEKGKTAQGNIGCFRSESTADWGVKIIDGLHLNFSGEFEPLVLPAFKPFFLQHAMDVV